ncbi:hypothetical protein A1O3_02180 [Capronia epimyces CBS 606.96]|uniref:Uncharacterized protein n=1 Tax=Capronia epimyces CBS 606.96 TaxID=1182542 RepID=W9YIN0_9EURO|nr:uncharacterized protein A1O3_02180 [Capronia epimyces CBS 606.96]EXJ89116.1 hypothetical protein A1O3_02180 [Capronia epimyces CBS 606.96]
MCTHLDSVMPDNEEKVLIHQDFWRHRRSCARCSGRNKVTSYAWKTTVCPLEHLVKRDIKDQPVGEDADALPIKEPSRKRRKIQEANDEERIAANFVKVTYEIDDDFDAAQAGKTGKSRTIWFYDFNKMEFKVEEIIVEEDDTIFEEIIISRI